MWIDELLRSAWGFAACWPALALCRRCGLKPAPTTAMITLYMIPVWRLYAIVEALVCG